uniref:ATP synthase subunit a n=1 Tax=Melanotrichia acclivopennis TaxID=2904888 RepID=A0A9E8LP01_9NEOP|nr:ATP synthase F0 subunit 6 [Melanotrichia acclivopennis]UZZ44147.1 ATP synthase F0 subunit 6 [Melanotrichia acclivopennis]
MMNNLFNMFDPSTSNNLSLNWISSILIMLLMPMSMWLTPNKFYISMNMIINMLISELKMSIKNNNFIMIFLSIFMFILLNNFMGLFPYIFTSSSHMSMNLTMSLIMWISLMMFGWINNTNHMFIHLIPQSTPIALMPFMVLIETISNLIRPLTLSVRLTANMIAGHLLMTLLSSMKYNLSNYILWLLILTQIILLTLESSVAIIQAYVFMTLSSLYCSEV